MYGLINCYRAAGIDDYDWRRFGPDLNNAEWDYISFDPPETLPADQGNRYREVTFPDGMTNWIVPEFDADKAGWMKGWQPFGQLDGRLEPLSETCTAPFCRCSEKPRTLWEKEVLLIRGTLDIPSLKRDHRYRIVLGGAAHVNSGEGYAIYVNGKLASRQNAVGTNVGMADCSEKRGTLRHCFVSRHSPDCFKILRFIVRKTLQPKPAHPLC